MALPTPTNVVSAAAAACRSLARCENFFNFDESESWLGWENWLTVDIVRRLNHRTVVRFGAYANGTKSDIKILGKRPFVVEIKANFVDLAEVKKWEERKSGGLPARVEKDLRKLSRSVRRTRRLMLLATGLENPRQTRRRYKRLIDADLAKHWGAWKRSWIGCGHILLLAMSK